MKIALLPARGAGIDSAHVAINFMTGLQELTQMLTGIIRMEGQAEQKVTICFMESEVARRKGGEVRPSKAHANI